MVGQQTIRNRSQLVEDRGISWLKIEESTNKKVGSLGKNKLDHNLKSWISLNKTLVRIILAEMLAENGFSDTN